MRELMAGLYALRLPGVVMHLLVDEAGCAVMDTGLAGGPATVRKAMRRLGRPMSDLRWILLTHGHLDHAGGAAAIKRQTGAELRAHPAEQRHLEGRWPYEGIARVCGWMEAVGRAAFRYEPAEIDRPFEPGEHLHIWGGLEVVHLPGHTAGHCGFYSRRHDLLFAGDLIFAGLRTDKPPAIFNSVPQRFDEAFAAVDRLNPTRIVVNHYAPTLSPEDLAARYRELRRRQQAAAASEPS